MNSNFLYDFLYYISKIQPEEFFGVCKILCVEFSEIKPGQIKKTIRDFESITSDLIDKFCILNRKQRKELIKIMKQACQE